MNNNPSLINQINEVVDDWETIADNIDNLSSQIGSLNITPSVSVTTSITTPSISTSVNISTVPPNQDYIVDVSNNENIEGWGGAANGAGMNGPEFLANNPWDQPDLFNNVSPIVSSSTRIKKNIKVKKEEKFSHQMKIPYKKINLKEIFDEKKYLSDINTTFFEVQPTH